MTPPPDANGWRIGMDRINAYCTEQEDGGITVDTEGMAVDLITIVKGVGMSKEVFMDLMSQTWDLVSVEIKFPKDKVN